MRSVGLVALLVMIGCAVDVETSIETQHATGTSLSLNKPTYTQGEAIDFTFGGFFGAATDWIGIAHPTDDDATVLAWTWTNGGTDGVVALRADLSPGDYEARGYFDYQSTQDYIVRVRQTFSVVAAPPPPPPPDPSGVSISTASSYAAGAPIVVSFGGLPANPLNWIGLASASTPGTSFILYQYVATAGGQVTFGGLPAGNYEARAFLNDGYAIARSAAFTVANAPTTTPTIATSKSTYAPGESVVVTYSTNGHATDWISLSVAGSGVTAYVTYAFVDGTGTKTFNALPAGNYEARYYRDDGFVIASQVAFSVSAILPSGQVAIATNKPSYALGESVVVTYLQNHPNDWISIAKVGTPATSYLAFAYVDPTNSKTFSGLPTGSYEARYYRDDGFVIAAVAAFTIVNTTPPPPTPATVTLSTSKTVYTSKQNIQVHYTNLGQAGDWVSLAFAGSPDTKFRAYQYTPIGAVDGHLLFGELDPGNYEVRAMHNDSFVVVARITFTVIPHKNGN